MKAFIYGMGGLLVLGMSGCSNPSASFLKELDAYCRSHYSATEPGVALLVAQPGKKLLFAKGYGLADLKTRAPITPRTLFNLGSVTKTMVGLGILRLAQEQKLSLEDPLLKYFPQFQHPEIVEAIQLKHLLSHTSGLPDNRPVARDSIFYLTANDAENFAPLLATDSLHFAPGSQYEYSNPAFNGLALILEKVSGKKWQQYLQEILFEPAGMRESVFTDSAFPDQGVAHGYQYAQNSWQEYDYGEYPTFCASGNGGAWSSAEELLRYEEAIEQHRLLNPDYTRLARSIFQPANWSGPNGPQTGFDWFVRPLCGWNSIGHTGDQGGFRADYVYFPEQNIFCVCLSNGSHDLATLRCEVVRLLQQYILR